MKKRFSCGCALQRWVLGRWVAALVVLVVALCASSAIAQPDLPLASRVRVLDHWLTEQVDYKAIPGVVVGVVDDQRLVWSSARGEGLTGDTPLRMGSVSKIFTSTAIVALRDQGKLALDDPVAQHLPWFTLALKEPFDGKALAADGARYQSSQLDGSGITLRHLLTHTGGLPREAGVPYWTDHVFPDSERLASVVRQQSALWPPGHDYQYSNLGLGLLGEVVAAASGLTWAEYLEQTVFGPLGMAKSTGAPDSGTLAALAPGYQRRMPDGSRARFDYYDTAALSGAANVISTLNDMAKFASLHLLAAGAGQVDAREDGAAIARGSLREMHAVHWASDALTTVRGLGFSVSERGGQRVVSHGGWIAGHRSHLILIPDQRIAAIAIVNADDVSPSFFANEALDVLRPAILAKRSRGGSEATRQRSRPRGFAPFEGTYSDPWGSYYEVMDLNGELYFYEHSYPPADSALSSLTWLEPDGAGGFVFGKAKDPVRFELQAEDESEEGSATQRSVVRILRRSDYLFPVRDDGSIVIDVP